MAILRRGPLNGGFECRCGMKKLRFLTNILLYLGNNTRYGHIRIIYQMVPFPRQKLALCKKWCKYGFWPIIFIRGHFEKKTWVQSLHTLDSATLPSKERSDSWSHLHECIRRNSHSTLCPRIQLATGISTVTDTLQISADKQYVRPRWSTRYAAIPAVCR